MSPALPARPHLDWYRNAAKARLAEMRVADPRARLADAQLAVAREHGFASWRTLRAQIDAALAAALLEAIRRGDLDEVERLLALEPKLMAMRTPAGQTPLIVAAEANQPRIVATLLARGADPRAKYGASAHDALSWAVTTWAFEAAEALVRGGVAADLFSAAGLGALDLVKAHFDEDGRVRAGASRTGSSRFAADGSRLPTPPGDPREVVSDALCMASRSGRADVVRFLLARDPDLGFRAFLGGTALHWAYFGGSGEAIALLLDAGADPTLRDGEFDCTPRAFGICCAANWGLPQRVEAALRLDASLANVHDGRGTPLHEAARAGEAEVVRLLLAAGASPTTRDAGGATPIDLAERHGHATVVALLRAP